MVLLSLLHIFRSITCFPKSFDDLCLFWAFVLNYVEDLAFFSNNVRYEPMVVHFLGASRQKCFSSYIHPWCILAWHVHMKQSIVARWPVFSFFMSLLGGLCSKHSLLFWKSPILFVVGVLQGWNRDWHHMKSELLWGFLLFSSCCAYVATDIGYDSLIK
jgi:hypothetical protein